MAKPILSTRVMKLKWGSYHAPKGREMLCADQLMRVFRRRVWPTRIRLHAFARAAKGRKRIRLDVSGSSVYWTTAAHGEPFGFVCWDFSRWLLRRAAFSLRLRAGEVVTLYVELQIVEGAAK